MSTPPSNNIEDVDFDRVYQGEQVAAGVRGVPWDIGEPQPLVTELVAAGAITGDVLDAGCGLGDNSLHLAEHGLRVTSLDGSPTAIDRLRDRAGERGLDIETVVADATDLAGMTDRFDTVLDSALYHCLGDEEQRSYVAALHRACRASATVHLICLAQDMGPLPGPNASSEQQLRDRFADGWEIEELINAAYTTAFTEADLDAIRQANPEVDTDPAALEAVRTDQQGRYLMPVWHLTARRVP